MNRNRLTTLSAIVGLVLAAPGWAQPAEAEGAPATPEEIRRLREELKAAQDAATANAAALEALSARVDSTVTSAELEALRDIEEEHILRSVGSSSSISPYTVSGNQHLVNLTGSAGLGYTILPGGPATNISRSFKLTSLSLALTGRLRNNPGADGDVRFNIGVVGSPAKYSATANASQSAASAAADTVAKSTANGAFLSASDVWVAWDIKTTKLELEPTWTLTLQAGQFLVPFGIEAISTENSRPTINQAQFVSKLGFTRDLGIIATGGFVHRNDPSAVTTPLFNYTLGIFNGAGPNSFDTNTGFDVLARLVFNPFYKFAENFRNLSFGGTYLNGNLKPAAGVLPKKLRFGGDLSWLRKPFLLTAEYVQSKDGYGNRNAPLTGTGPSPTAPFAESRSYVATLFWTPSTLPDFQPWGRIDRLKPVAFSNLTEEAKKSADLNGNGNDVRFAYSLGFNWFIWSVEPVTRRKYATPATNRVIKLQASYTRYALEGSTGPKNQVDVSLIGSL